MAATCDYCGSAASGETKLNQCSCCKSRVYCNKACQQADWPTHRQWCKACESAKNCNICTRIQSCVHPITTLHSSAIKDLATLVQLLKDDKFAIVAHGPFFSNDPGKDMDLAMVAVIQVNIGATNREMRSDNMDIIIKSSTFVKYGNWADMKRNLALGFSKLDDEPKCCVCNEEVLVNSCCAVCTEIICRGCLDKWTTASAGVTTCPMCRAEFIRRW